MMYECDDCENCGMEPSCADADAEGYTLCQCCWDEFQANFENVAALPETERGVCVNCSERPVCNDGEEMDLCQGLPVGRA